MYNMYTGIHIYYEDIMAEKNINGYKSIAAELKKRILDGSLVAGSRLESERCLAESWQVERTTIRRALEVLADERLIIKRPGCPTVVAKSMPQISFINTSQSGLMTTHHFITPVYRKFAELCGDGGYRSIGMTIAEAGRLDSFEAVLDQSLGIILCDNVPVEFLEIAKSKKLPCVLMSERAYGFRSVVIDNDSGLAQAVAHLVSLGHRHIAYIGGDRIFLNSLARADGFRHALYSLGIEETKPVIQFCGWTVEQGREGMKQLLDEHPEITAVCCVNDDVALGACRVARESGRRIPDDISIIGFGDMLKEERAEIKLTTVRVPYDRFARELYRALIQEIEHPYQDPAAVLVETELVIRDTTEKLS